MNQQSLPQWLDYIGQLHAQRVDLGLERIAAMANKLELTHFSCPVITVAGTNGKGSTIATLEAVYQAAGYQVATYTSPHLIKFNERIRFDKQPISDEALCRLFTCIEQARGEESLSFFEFTTLAALYYFKQIKPDVILLEVGLGGRLDAVNVVDCDVAVITSIALDHCDWLGDTREVIALEKAGIMRANKPVVCGELDPPNSLQEVFANHDDAVYRIGQEFHVSIKGNEWCFQSGKVAIEHLPLSSLKLQNIATALQTVFVLQDRLAVDTQTLQKALCELKLKGRFTQLNEPHDCIIDVAHNPAAVEWLMRQLKTLPAKRHHIVFAALSDKNITQMLEQVDVDVAAWYCSSLSVPRGASAAQILASKQASAEKNWYTFETVSHAFHAAQQVCQPNERIVVFGSFHTAADVFEALQQDGCIINDEGR